MVSENLTQIRLLLNRIDAAIEPISISATADKMRIRLRAGIDLTSGSLQTIEDVFGIGKDDITIVTDADGNDDISAGDTIEIPANKAQQSAMLYADKKLQEFGYGFAAGMLIGHARGLRAMSGATPALTRETLQETVNIKDSDTVNPLTQMIFSNSIAALNTLLEAKQATDTLMQYPAIQFLDRIGSALKFLLMDQFDNMLAPDNAQIRADAGIFEPDSGVAHLTRKTSSVEIG